MLTLEPVTSSGYAEEYKAKKQFFDQRREYNAILAQEARSEHLADIIREAAQQMNAERPLEFDGCNLSLMTGREGVLILSDWHYGMVANNIWNQFNVQICRARVRYVVERAVKQIREHGVNTLHVVILGDMAAGAIHTSARVASEEDVCDQLMHVSELLAESIAELSNYVGKTYVYSTYGNHMRTVASFKDSIHEDNMEKIIPWWLRWRLIECDSIEIIDSDAHEFIRLSVCGENLLATHGDLDSDKQAAIRLNTLHEKLYGEGIDYLLTAHVHHVEGCETLGIEHIQVGCLCGTDEYAKTKRLYSLPSQTMLIYDPVYGLDSVCNIRLDSKKGM